VHVLVRSPFDDAPYIAELHVLSVAMWSAAPGTTTNSVVIACTMTGFRSHCLLLRTGDEMAQETVLFEDLELGMMQ
jgi:hypothetical protein